MGSRSSGGDAARKKGKNFFSKRLPEPKECLPLQPGSAEPVFLGKDLEDYRAARLGWPQIEVL